MKLEPKDFIFVGDKMSNKETIEKVNSPKHYKSALMEVIDIIEAFRLNFSRGNVVKYLLRAGSKTEEGIDDLDKEIEDLEKASWYLSRELKNLYKKKESLT